MIAQTSQGARPPAYFFPVVDDLNTACSFLWCGSDMPNCWDVQLQRRHGGRCFLGRIERNERLNCWYVTHMGNAPLNRAESSPFLGWHDAAQYLHEHWQQQRRAQRIQELAEV